MLVRASGEMVAEVARLAHQMWTGSSLEELETDFAKLLAGDDGIIFLYMTEEHAVGFAQCQLRRDYVEGTTSSPVGYLEGVFVEPGCRKRGYGKALVDACVQWAKEKGCREFASDCELKNEQSRRFHLQTGFQEANRIICFVRPI